MANIKPQIKEREERGVTKAELEQIHRILQNEADYWKAELNKNRSSWANATYTNKLSLLYSKLEILEEIMELTYCKESERYKKISSKYEFHEEEG